MALEDKPSRHPMRQAANAGLARRGLRRHGALESWSIGIGWTMGNLTPSRNAGQGIGGSLRPPIASRETGKGGAPGAFADVVIRSPSRQGGTDAKEPSAPSRMGNDANWKHGALVTGRQVTEGPRQPDNLATWNLGEMGPGDNGEFSDLIMRGQVNQVKPSPRLLGIQVNSAPWIQGGKAPWWASELAEWVPWRRIKHGKLSTWRLES